MKDIQNAIGYSYKGGFYTLWEITTHETYSPVGRRIYKLYKYVKNISKNKEAAFSKYPDAVFDDSLAGPSFSKLDHIEYDSTTKYAYGKYSGQEINEVDDRDYLGWYYINMDDYIHADSEDFFENHKKFVEQVLHEKYDWVFENGKLYNEYEYAMMIVAKKNINEVLTKKENHENLEFIADNNVDGYGKIEINGVNYQFSKVSHHSYAGYSYYLPVLNGKSKRIRGKKIIVTDYECENTNDCGCENTNSAILIKINNFKIQ